MQHAPPFDMLSKYRDFSINIADGALYYVPCWLSEEEAAALYPCLADELAWRQDSVKVFGKWHLIPRLQAWYGEPSASYRYSGKTLTPLPWHPALKRLQDQLLSEGMLTNAVLANLYRDGSDKMGWHNDNELELGSQPVIASVSIGAQRTFQLRHKKSGERIDLELESGSLLIMAGRTQENWLHALPQRKRIKQGRINLTFRMVNPNTN